ncbi:MAG: hypothetical protein QXH40_05530 [Candidatus Bathyarchaeia archaeon]
MLERLVPLILSVCLAFTVMFPAMAQYTTGVKSGDWIKYDADVSFSYQSSTYSFKGTINMTIQEVTSVSISGVIEVVGTTSGSPPDTPPISPGLKSFSIHIPSWTSSGMFFSLLIPSNLDAGKSIPETDMTVQETVDWHGRRALKSKYMNLEVYWDQATGVLLEMKGSASYETGYATVNIKATNTNMFILGLDWLPFIIIILAIMIVVAVVALIIMCRRKTPTAPNAPPPSLPT